MANGCYGTDAQWQRLEAPLERLDEILGRFAQHRGLTLIKNERDWPDRTFRWGTRPSKLIQIFPEDALTPAYTVWACAYDNRSRKEYWEHRTLLKAVPIESVIQQLPQLLSEAIRMVEKWEKAYCGAGYNGQESD